MLDEIMRLAIIISMAFSIACSSGVSMNSPAPPSPALNASPDPRPTVPSMSAEMAARAIVAGENDKPFTAVPSDDPRVKKVFTIVEDLTAQTGEDVSSIYLAIDGSAKKLDVPRVKFISDLDLAVRSGSWLRGGDLSFGMEVQRWAEQKYGR